MIKKANALKIIKIMKYNKKANIMKYNKKSQHFKTYKDYEI